MKRIVFYLSLAVTALFASCEKDANIDLPEVSPKLVLSGFISPQDTLLVVHVMRSRPVFNGYNTQTSTSVQDATVILSDGTNSIQLTFDTQQEWYSAPASAFAVTAGGSYSLTVTTPAGESASASTKIPSAPPAGYTTSLTWVTNDSDAYFYNRTFTITHNWQDAAGQTDDYRIAMLYIHKDISFPGGDTVLQLSNSHLITDNNNDGGTMELKADESGFYQAGLDSILGFESWLIRCSPEYYRYEQSIQNYSGGDPFSEPSLVFTNVTGGLGIFAGYNATVRRIYP